MRLALDREREVAVQLRRAHEMKDTFLRAVSHDLRTPLSVIVWLAQALGEDDIDMSQPGPRELLGRIEAHAQALDRLVVDLLDLDRLNQGGEALVREPTDMADLVRRMVERSDVLDGRPILVEAETVLAYIDAAKVERIVGNLLANVDRHTPARSPVWIRVFSHAGGAMVVVEDSGPGVPENVRETIFEPFHRGMLARGAAGMGVGLSLIRQLARLHGGDAWAEDAPAGGASFRVWLPTDPASQHARLHGQQRVLHAPGLRPDADRSLDVRPERLRRRREVEAGLVVEHVRELHEHRRQLVAVRLGHQPDRPCREPA
jgi:two-component system CheB/CheR fusion protein